MKIAAPRATLTTEAIHAMLNAAIARAQALDARLHISIMDSAANLVGFISCEGAPRIAAITANRKAFTAVNTGMPTGQWEAYVNSIPASTCYLDGRSLGSTPKGHIGVKPGSHTVKFVTPDGQSQSVTVTVGAGQTKPAVARFSTPSE